ncbi:hypothetical protein V6N13_020679 [Hibiscus sabdariffa]
MLSRLSSGSWVGAWFKQLAHPIGAEENPDFYNWNRVKPHVTVFTPEGKNGVTLNCKNSLNSCRLQNQCSWRAYLKGYVWGCVYLTVLFPQNLVANIKTPMFLLNTACDAWQVKRF